MFLLFQFSFYTITEIRAETTLDATNFKNNTDKTKNNYAKVKLFDRLSVRNISNIISEPPQFVDSNSTSLVLTSSANLNLEQYKTSTVEDSEFIMRGKLSDCRCRVRDYFRRRFPYLCSDFRNFNSCDSLGNLFVAFGGAAVLANTSLDGDFRNWFYRNIKRPNANNKGLHDFNAFSKEFGEIPIILIFALSTAGYKLFPYLCPKRETHKSIFGEYVTLVSRSYLIGTPANLLGQLFVGAGRPSSGSSFWFKGKFNGVSGHSFVGAVPFITAAQMTDNLWFKCIFYTCSFFTATSRIYEDSHYLSQALLGWYIAYLSVRAVSKTEGKKLPRGLTIFPIVEKESTGVGLVFRF
ncbi:MAG: phosphatase PAP2 family protein [Planctomycetaceae bacterium]|nr:phosphatase PAP2 family protein [Planctomycetaceae bacterium]